MVNIAHLERRRIEAGVLIPMIQAFQRAIGKERANDIAREVIRELAKRDGGTWAEQMGGDLSGLERLAHDVWAGGGSLEIERLQSSDQALDFNVTRCRYAELYQELGLPELGALFHCSRDFSVVESFEGVTLTRTQTIMQGASHCDFRFRREERK